MEIQYPLDAWSILQGYDLREIIIIQISNVYYFEVTKGDTKRKIYIDSIVIRWYGQCAVKINIFKGK